MPERQHTDGDHYQAMPVQPVDFAMINHMGFCEGSIVKYVSRWRRKGGVRDLEKARDFIRYLRDDNEYSHRHSTLRNLFTETRLSGRSPATSIKREGMLPEDYCRQNGITDANERQIIFHVWNYSTWGGDQELHCAELYLRDLINEQGQDDAQTGESAQ